MKLIKGITIICIIVSMMLLSACARKRGVDPRLIQQANAAYAQGQDREDFGPVATSGIGENARFADGQRRHQANLKAKRTYYFDFDSYAVHHDDKPAIAANADYLLTHPQTKIMLEGHTDPRGSREYNIGLGERRAKAVAGVLTTKGVNRSQIRIVSYGAQKLASTGRTESDYQQDRRGVLVELRDEDNHVISPTKR